MGKGKKYKIQLGEQFEKLWRMKYNNETEFSVAHDIPFSRKQMYNLKAENASPKFNSLEIFSIKMEIPVFIIAGFFKGEIEIDDNNNWIVIKTGQHIEKY